MVTRLMPETEFCRALEISRPALYAMVKEGLPCYEITDHTSDTEEFDFSTYIIDVEVFYAWLQEKADGYKVGDWDGLEECLREKRLAITQRSERSPSQVPPDSPSLRAEAKQDPPWITEAKQDPQWVPVEVLET